MRIILGISLFITLLLVGCSDKTDKKSGPSSAATSITQVEKKASAQQSPDRIQIIAGLPWHSHVETAFKEAQKAHKNVVIMVGEENCRWCVKMKERTLIDTRIKEALENYVLVSVKRSDKEALKYIPQFDGNIPSFFFMTEDKETIEPVVGYFKADDFLAYIKEIEEES